MKRLIGLILLVTSLQISAQTNTDLLKHYEAYYKQMKKQSDVNGVIGALTHLNLLSPLKPTFSRRETNTTVMLMMVT